MKTALRVAVGLAVSALFLWLAFRGFDVKDIFAQIRSISLPWLAVAIGLSIVDLLMRSLRWKGVLSSMEPVPYRTVFPVLLVGYLMNCVLPARGGELVRAGALARHSRVPLSSSMGSIVADRTLDLFGVLTVALIAAKLLPWDKVPIVPLASAMLVAIVGMYGFTVFLSKGKEGGEGARSKVLSFLRKLGAGFAIIRSPVKFGSLALLAAATWVLDALIVAAMSRATGLDLSFTQACAVQTGIAVGVAIPAAPGYVGTYEFFGREVLTIMGFAPGPSLTLVVLMHFFQLATLACVAIPAMIILARRPLPTELP